jgi:hypothetical protein
MLAAVPLCAGYYRFVHGFPVGADAVDPELWGFCGDANRQIATDPPAVHYLYAQARLFAGA